jgi:hypothetical protein
MDVVTPVVQEFFDQYARSRSAMDVDRIASQYADACMFAGPDGARVAEKQAVLEGFPKGARTIEDGGSHVYEACVGKRSEDRRTLRNGAAQFVWRFEKADALPTEVAVDSTFILYIKDGVTTIVFQHEHEDFWLAQRTSGVLPAQA